MMLVRNRFINILVFKTVAFPQLTFVPISTGQPRRFGQVSIRSKNVSALKKTVGCPKMQRISFWMSMMKLEKQDDKDEANIVA